MGSGNNHLYSGRMERKGLRKTAIPCIRRDTEKAEDSESERMHCVYRAGRRTSYQRQYGISYPYGISAGGNIS